MRSPQRTSSAARSCTRRRGNKKSQRCPDEKAAARTIFMSTRENASTTSVSPKKASQDLSARSHASKKSSVPLRPSNKPTSDANLRTKGLQSRCKWPHSSNVGGPFNSASLPNSAANTCACACPPCCIVCSHFKRRMANSPRARRTFQKRNTRSLVAARYCTESSASSLYALVQAPPSIIIRK